MPAADFLKESDNNKMNESSTLNIANVLAPKSFTIFCGAGISINSGLPSAKELEHSILNRLSVDRSDISAVLESSLPFEAFMEILSDYSDASKILLHKYRNCLC
jgi:hypothetical protein